MARSSGKFSEGRKAGLRDAKNSMWDQSGGWMWLWMMDAEYRTGYDQGWNEGRHMLKYRAHQERARSAWDPRGPAKTSEGE